MTRRGSRRVPVVALAVAAAVVVPPLVVQDAYLMHLLVLAAIFTMLASSLNLVIGYSGILSLGHHAFFGLGAYTSTLVALGGAPVVLAASAAVAAAGLLARLVGAILLRLRSAYFVISSIAVAEILRLVSLNWVEVTGGPMGIANVPRLGIGLPGLGSLDLSSPFRAYYVIAPLTVATVLVIAWITRSVMGRGLVAMREGEYLARSIGIDTSRLALYSVVIGSAIAGLAGALYAHYVQFVSPEVLLFLIMITILVMVLGGGVGTLMGPVLGGLLFTVVPEFLRASNEFRILLYGAIVVLVVRFAPGGLWGTALALLRRYRGRPARPPDRAATAPGVAPRVPVPSAVSDARRPGRPGWHQGDGASRRERSPLLDVRGLTVRFGGLVAVSDLSLHLWPQEVLGLIGPNGAGKTTVFNALSGFVKPASGRVLFDGEDLVRKPPFAIARLGLVRTFQKRSFFADQTILDNVLVALIQPHHAEGSPRHRLHRLLGPPPEHAEGAARDLLRLTGLWDKRTEMAANLPYGEQRILGLTIALAARPRVLMLDEPCAGMTPSEIDRILQLVARIREHGVTMIVVEHQMRFVMGISDRVVVLDHGVKLAEGTPGEVRRDARVVEAYLGRGTDEAHRPHFA